jgi:putative RNA 2'-phosphotransferase
MTDQELIERITRSLAFMLRHQPETFDLELDPFGFADLEDVVHALNERLGEPVEEEDVVEAVRAGDRPRYEIQEGRIRALYGHSIPVEPGPSSKPPEFLYVAVPEQEVERARRFGLRGGRRRFLHLAITKEGATETGRRGSRDYTVLVIHALDAWEEGISFYDRTALWLAEEVPTHLLEVAETFHDGSDPFPRRHEGGREAGRDHGRSDERESHREGYREGYGQGTQGGGRGRRRGRGGRGRDRRPRPGEPREAHTDFQPHEAGALEERPRAPAFSEERGSRARGGEGRGGGGFERRGPREAAHGSRGGDRHEPRREERREEHHDERREPHRSERPPEAQRERRAERPPREERRTETPSGFGAGLDASEAAPPRDSRPAAATPRPAPVPRAPVEDRPAFGAGL